MATAHGGYKFLLNKCSLRGDGLEKMGVTACEGESQNIIMWQLRKLLDLNASSISVLLEGPL